MIPEIDFESMHRFVSTWKETGARPGSSLRAVCRFTVMINLIAC